MKNELRAIADNYNKQKQIERANKVTEFVDKRIVPEMKKQAALGHYHYTLALWGDFRPIEVIEEIENRGFEVHYTRGTYHVNW
jgi:hypothetical protein